MIHSVLFDLAGTTIDCGCRAPVGVFIEAFRRRGVAISEMIARGPMGTAKREHIRRLTRVPEVAQAWVAAHGALPTEADVDDLYAEAEPLQIEVLPQFATPFPGVSALMTALRARGLKLGATTGYTAPMVAVLAPLISAAGWTPDVLVCTSDVSEGRPAPYMNWRAAAALGAPSADSVVVVGDTPVDMQAARRAGMWAVGVTLTGNEVGLDAEALHALTEPQRVAHRAQADWRLRAAGAQYLIDSVLELPAVLDHITAFLSLGRRSVPQP